MGKRGPAPKPTTLKKLEGNPGKRALNASEPRPAAKLPTCPRHLSKEARSEWRRITKELAEMKLLTAVDRAALAAYCQCWARWVEIELELQAIDPETNMPKHELIGSTDKGYDFANPLLGAANNALKQMKLFLVEFGMTPSSRSRISLPPEESEDPYEQFRLRPVGNPFSNGEDDDLDGAAMSQAKRGALG